MNLEINALGFDMTTAMRQHIVQRFKFGFSQFSDLNLFIRVTLFNSSGPLGVDDISAHLYLSAPGLQKTVIREEQSDIYRAIDLAISRAQHKVLMKISCDRDQYLSPFLRGRIADPFSGPAHLSPGGSP